jgi:Enoyl-CoA hydratase/isomerase
VMRCCENPDFYEGVRALLIDRDNKPQWNPPTLAQGRATKMKHFYIKIQ